MGQNLRPTSGLNPNYRKESLDFRVKNPTNPIDFPTMSIIKILITKYDFLGPYL